MPDELSCAQMTIFVDTVMSDLQDLADEQVLDSGKEAILDTAKLFNSRICEWFTQKDCPDEAIVWECQKRRMLTPLEGEEE